MPRRYAAGTPVRVPLEPPSSPPSRPQTPWIWWAVVLLVCFWDLGGRSLHDLDTARWGQLAREMIRSDSWLVPTRYGELYVNKPPLYLWLVAGPARLFGEVTPFLVRLPSALGLLLLVVSTHRWTRWRTGADRAGRVAGMLLLGTAIVAWLGRGGRLDMMGIGLSAFATWWIDVAATERENRRAPWICGLALGLALLTKGPPLWLAPLAVWLLPHAGSGPWRRFLAARPWIFLPLAFALAAAWFVPAVLSAGWEAYGEKLLFKQATTRLAGTERHVMPLWHYVMNTPLVAAPWGLAFLGTAFLPLHKRGRRWLGPMLSVAVAALVVFLVFTAIPVKHDRYLGGIVPLMAAPLGWLVHRWLDGPARGHWRIHQRGLAVLGLVGGLALIVACAQKPGGLLAAFPVGLAAALLGALSLRASRSEVEEHMRRAHWIGVLLPLVAVLLLGLNILRPLFHDGSIEVFNDRLAAAARPGEAVYVVPGLTPERVFHGAPQAQYPLEPGAAVPADASPVYWIVCNGPFAQRMIAAQELAGHIVIEAPGSTDWVAIRFAAE